VSIRPEDWEILGLEPGADVGQVRRAYRHRRSLYEPAALATYNLLDDEERDDMVDRIDDAYRRIMGSDPPAAAPTPPPPTVSKPAVGNEVPIGDAPDPVSEPGAHLRFRRAARGFTLHQIAAETKIGVTILEQIENEDFDALPAPAFVRGHVHQFARELKLPDAYEFAKLYLHKMQGGDSQEDE
jgi:hypothetical protein